jgi:ribosomal protein S18 acetylase RimI-like enzyme
MEIGSYLLLLIINYAQRNFSAVIYLHTKFTDERGIKFYKKLHFHIDLFVENYHGTTSTFYLHVCQMNRRI